MLDVASFYVAAVTEIHTEDVFFIMRNTCPAFIFSVNKKYVILPMDSHNHFFSANFRYCLILMT